MNPTPVCPECRSVNCYPDQNMLVCPECFHEWDPSATPDTATEDRTERVVKDSNGTVLSDGDSVTVIKSMKVKGSPVDIKVGTKVKGIRLIEGENGHDISCRVEGIGAMYLKSEFVRKA